MPSGNRSGVEAYIIGIDLGTTNCSLSYIHQQAGAIENEVCEIAQFPIPQIVKAGEEGERPLLPSFLYFPLAEELQAGNVALSWDKKIEHCLGVFARDRGAELPHRLIHSAKSWLCHEGINRRERFLPLEAEDDCPKISPLEAIQACLAHLKDAFLADHAMRFEEQKVLITVPASFAPDARQLVLEAAIACGYPEPVLLEEPQAAFYSWLHLHAKDWREQLHLGDRLLVVDIGGGTTDFSLIEVQEEKGSIILRRKAVGDHLLLGGDNIDLSLSYFALKKLQREKNVDLDDWQLSHLVHAARFAKEQLMGEKPPKEVTLSIPGRGRKLIGGALNVRLNPKEASDLLLEGFFPLVAFEERPNRQDRSGMRQLGLPYAFDPRITCHLADFLSQEMPTHVLFNGGTLKAKAFQNRLMQQLNTWAKACGLPDVMNLKDGDLDFAVSRGAAYYGAVCKGRGIRLRSASPRSYFIGVQNPSPAVPGREPLLDAVCLVPKGMEEGSEIILEEREFALLLGEEALFHFFCFSKDKLLNGKTPQAGMLLKNAKAELTQLHPIEAYLDKKPGDPRVVRVKLKAKISELGVLTLYCLAEDGREWKLEFDNLRQSAAIA